jgi:hypothetical protein
MNPLYETVTVGAVGEMLVQIRLLEFEIQAAPPLRDSGNDLIALKGSVTRCIQVKTTTKAEFPRKIKRQFHLLAVVELIIEDDHYMLDRCSVYLLTRQEFENHAGGCSELGKYKLTRKRVDECFKENH